MSKIKLAGKSISEILKRIKRAKRNKKATQNQEKVGLSTKSIKPFNYRAGARDEQIVPVKKQSQTGSSFQPHRVRGKQGAASIKETSEGSAASWRDEMDKYFGDLRPSKFFKKASGGDINTGMKKLSPKQKAIAAKAPPPDKIDAKDFAVLKAEKAKGRGMGLQDEKIKPGKVMKVRSGKFMERRMKLMGAGKEIKADPTKPVNPFEKRRKKLGGSKLPGKIGTVLGIASMMVPAAYAAAKQYKDYKSAKNRDKAKVKKYSSGGASSKEVYTNARANVDAEGRKNMTMKDLKEARRETSATKKMGGGMAKKYSVGGGADTGRAGERRSRLLTAVQRAARRARTRREGKELGPIGGFGAIPSPKRTPRATPMPALGNEDRLTDKDLEYAKAGLTGAARPIGSSVIKAAKKFRDNYKADVRDQAKVKKMGGGMMQRPMGYKSGTMVKARGCKLGRTRPTKIT